MADESTPGDTMRGRVPGSRLRFWLLLRANRWGVAAGTVSLIPFAVLFAYVLRIATVAKRTLAIGPFALRETEWTDNIDWDA